MDRYSERLVKGRAGSNAYLLTALSILVILLGIASFLFVDAGGGLFLLVLGVTGIVLVRDLYNIEYEYIITNGDIDIAKIIAKKSRKLVKSIPAGDILSIESLDNPRVKNDLEVKKDIVIRDYTEKAKNGSYYVVQAKEKDKVVFNIMDLDEKSVDNIRYALKHKISGAPVRLEK